MWAAQQWHHVDEVETPAGGPCALAPVSVGSPDKLRRSRGHRLPNEAVISRPQIRPVEVCVCVWPVYIPEACGESVSVPGSPACLDGYVAPPVAAGGVFLDLFFLWKTIGSCPQRPPSYP